MGANLAQMELESSHQYTLGGGSSYINSNQF